MPVYEYQCKTCGVRFERTQSFNDAPIKICPECGGETHRVIGATGIIFKGSGFYVNDSKSKSSASTPVTSGKAEKSESKSEGAAETKSEAKSESSTSASTSNSTSSTPSTASS